MKNKSRAKDAAADGKAALEMGRSLEEIEAWQYALADGPKFKGVVDPYSPMVEAIALKCSGYSALNLITRLALGGHPKAISDLVRLARDLTQTLEDTARLYPKETQARSALVPDWPVMLCRHEGNGSDRRLVRPANSFRVVAVEGQFVSFGQGHARGEWRPRAPGKFPLLALLGWAKFYPSTNGSPKSGSALQSKSSKNMESQSMASSR